MKTLISEASVYADNTKELFDRFGNIPALSIKQPWAHLITAGHKDIENRSWQTNFRGKFYIHTGKKRDTMAPIQTFTNLLEPSLLSDFANQFHRLPLGGIIGVAEIVDCVEYSESRWFNGLYGFVIVNPVHVSFVPCRGQLGFWKPFNSYNQFIETRSIKCQEKK